MPITPAEITAPALSFRIRSQSNPAHSYRLTKLAEGWACTCPGFTFRATCKHVEQVGAAEKADVLDAILAAIAEVPAPTPAHVPGVACDDPFACHACQSEAEEAAAHAQALHDAQLAADADRALAVKAGTAAIPVQGDFVPGCGCDHLDCERCAADVAEETQRDAIADGLTAFAAALVESGALVRLARVAPQRRSTRLRARATAAEGGAAVTAPRVPLCWDVPLALDLEAVANCSGEMPACASSCASRSARGWDEPPEYACDCGAENELPPVHEALTDLRCALDVLEHRRAARNRRAA